MVCDVLRSPGGGVSVRRASLPGCDDGGEVSTHADHQPGRRAAALAGGHAEARDRCGHISMLPPRQFLADGHRNNLWRVPRGYS